MILETITKFIGITDDNDMLTENNMTVGCKVFAQSELQLENSLVAQLENQGWKRIVLEDYDALEDNFREQFNRFNRRVLNGTPLSDDEFRAVRAHISNRGVFESAKILRDSQLLTRDDGTVLHYSLFNTKEWCKNRFQVAQQVKTTGDKWNNRYDVTLLINGLPLIQIELKRNGVEINEAFNQICRYKRDNAYKGLFNFIQFFIVSNGVHTRYFANDEKELSNAFAFKWTDDKNKQYRSLSEFTSHFLDKCWSAKMIARYMVVQETDRRLIIMRPYQVYGTEQMVTRALETGNNGFIWHTTGSGKTLTSFKVSQILAQSGKFKKVFFLVDRRDLNKQTSEEFNRFKEGSISTSENTAALVASIKSDHVEERLILTTIQKLDKALKNPRFTAAMDALRDEKVAFVIDECHRSQYGDMQKLIREHFQKAQYFGFTGTPLFKENCSAGEKTTADVFEGCLHTYLLKDGIRDKNTLAFSVEYVNTITAKDTIENPDLEVEKLVTDEVWHSPLRIDKIVQDILQDRKRKSRNKQFNAMLTVDSVKAVALYMDAFKRAQAELDEDQKLTIATVYSYMDNMEVGPGESDAKDNLDSYISEYNEKFGTNHSLGEVQRYNSDVAEQFKKGHIDILLVVNMMLTGFDSKILNTLYVDRNFEYHSLIQAYSRTNRVYEGPKLVGHIRCYRNLKEKTDEAVKLFSNVSNANEVLSKPYSEQKKDFQEAIDLFMKKYPNPDDLHDVESETEKREFVISFREFAKMLRRIETFSEFQWADFNIDPQTVKVFESHYIDFRVKARESEGVSILNDIDFQMEQVLTDKINVDYIFRLLAELDVKDKVEVKKLRDMVEDEGTDKLRKKRDLLLDFIDSVVPTLSRGSNVMDEYQQYVDEKTRKEIEKRASGFGVSEAVMLAIVATHRFQGKFDGKIFMRNSSLSAKDKMTKRRELKTFVQSLSERFETEE